MAIDLNFIMDQCPYEVLIYESPRPSNVALYMHVAPGNLPWYTVYSGPFGERETDRFEEVQQAIRRFNELRGQS